MITIQLPIYNKLGIKSNNTTSVIGDLISFYRNLTLIKSPFDPINVNIIHTNIL